MVFKSMAYEVWHYMEYVEGAKVLWSSLSCKFIMYRQYESRPTVISTLPNWAFLIWLSCALLSCSVQVGIILECFSTTNSQRPFITITVNYTSSAYISLDCASITILQKAFDSWSDLPQWSYCLLCGNYTILPDKKLMSS